MLCSQTKTLGGSCPELRVADLAAGAGDQSEEPQARAGGHERKRREKLALLCREDVHIPAYRGLAAPIPDNTVDRARTPEGNGGRSA